MASEARKQHALASSEGRKRLEEMTLTPPQQMMASGAGALMVNLFMTPLDVVKIRLQAQERLYSKKCFLYSNGIMDHLCPRMNGDPPMASLHTAEEICNCKWYNRPKYFNGTFDAIVKISRTEGVSSLWSGLSPTMVLAIPTTMIYFTMYEQLKEIITNTHARYITGEKLPLSSSSQQHPPWISLTSGGLARVWAVTFVSPLELIRTKMQSQKMKLSQVKVCLEDVIKTQGIRGLWSGYTATLLRDVPFSALYWPLYEYTKRELDKLSVRHPMPTVSDSTVSFATSFAGGAVAGTVASTITLPFDVVKTTQQIEIGERDIMRTSKGVSRSNTMIFKQILNEQGVKGLYAGLAPRILKVAPACAIMISSYEFGKKFFKNRNLQDSNYKL